MEKLLLSTTEVAELLGVRRNRVYELIYCGLLASAKLGRPAASGVGSAGGSLM